MEAVLCELDRVRVVRTRGSADSEWLTNMAAVGVLAQFECLLSTSK